MRGNLPPVRGNYAAAASFVTFGPIAPKRAGPAAWEGRRVKTAGVGSWLALHVAKRPKGATPTWDDYATGTPSNSQGRPH